ncbi:acetoacetate--CoA ligase [Sulfitobacter sp. AS92]|uniref:acetoacetate--CoA ligase n=1 Tax=Sulfitobacter sp. AS92 TaxID=3135783 RepID=UPI00317CD0FF
MSEILFEPSETRVNETQLSAFMQSNGPFETYDALWQWSVSERSDFWAAVWRDCGIVGQAGSTVLHQGAHMIEDSFFPKARLNYAENLLAHSNAGTALIAHAEDGHRHEVSWSALRDQVSILQQALRNAGITKGDHVAGVMPNCIDTVVAMLAATSLGAVWSSCSPDFRLQTLLDRFGQIGPKIIFSVGGYRYNGKTHDCTEKLKSLVAELPNRPQLVLFTYAGVTPEAGLSVDTLCENIQPTPLSFESMAFADPLFVLFSSGTTGLPKCIIHGVGGTLLQHAKEHRLHCDITANDRLFFYTTCGWMMWNWQVSALATGATLVLFDGSPFFPSSSRLPDICDAEKVTHFGTSAKYIQSCQQGDLRPCETHDLASVRTILSTGSPLSEQGFRYVYDAWKQDVCLSSIAGGTDILGCFVGGSPVSPVYAGQVQKRMLGMDVQVYQDDRTSIVDQIGELVAIKSHPSMPIGFVDDPLRKRFMRAYFERFGDVWCQGDLVKLTAEGDMCFFGRSDTTLNPGGVRIGTAEIYRQLERVPEVLDAVAVGLKIGNDESILLGVILREDAELNDALRAKIRSEIRQNTSPRHVPATIVDVPEIPYTRSGKIAEIAVKQAVNGLNIANTSALRHVESLNFFKRLEVRT